MRVAWTFCAALILVPAGAQAVVIGGPMIRDGVVIVPSYQTGVELDRAPATIAQGPDAIHLQADVHAGKDEAHGFAEGAFIPYLSVSYVLTRDDDRTFHKAGLLYPMVSRSGPDYGTGVLMAGPGSYRLTYIVSPPPSHGVMRHTDKASGVPDWWKPITASWTFAYPSNMSAQK
jgi:uncharacterized protein involved in high-affinity Fe2+ transport